MAAQSGKHQTTAEKRKAHDSKRWSVPCKKEMVVTRQCIAM